MVEVVEAREDDMSDFLDKLFIDDDKNNWIPSEKIPIIVKEIDQLKFDLKAYLNECDLNIMELAEESEVLANESDELVQELDDCKKEIEVETMSEILKSIKDHDAIAEDLEKVNYLLAIVYDVVHCGKYFKDYDNYRANCSYRGAVETLTDVTDFLNAPADGFQSLAMYNALKSSVSFLWDELLRELSEEWDKMIYFEVDESRSNEKIQVIHIYLKLEDDPRNIDILLALSMCKQLKNKVAKFAAYLMKEVLIPIINRGCLVYGESRECMTINTPKTHLGKPTFEGVINNMRLIFNFLNYKLKIEIQNAETLMTMLGQEISAEYGDILIKDCLVGTIPSSISEFKNYGKVTANIESFERFLKGIKFFPSKNFSILQYANNLDFLFANKTSQYFLKTAREIMMKDLSSLMSIGVERVPDVEESPINIDETIDEALKIYESALPKSLFYFPRCMISKSAQELLDLVHVIMEQTPQCSDLVRKRLYMTTRLIFELYDAVVPYHHETFLLTIPQYVALFHNNCMYLAHNLLTLGEKWMLHLQGCTLDYTVSFVDLVQRIRHLGYKHLAIHMQQQRKQILDNIRSSDLNCIVVKDVLGENAEQAIRQCLRQLQVLKNVWIGVFPPNVFKRLMACLVNMFVEEIIHRVCTVEDISAEMATQLTDIYTIVVKKAPNLFQNEKDLEMNVKSWIKLQELILILGGSLKDIEKRWNDGTGPLAIHFKREELRSLIKALFQNTQFRANLLSKIK